jgi:hypothetical protein
VLMKYVPQVLSTVLCAQARILYVPEATVLAL